MARGRGSTKSKVKWENNRKMLYNRNLGKEECVLRRR
jgi:hypothetical protein